MDVVVDNWFNFKEMAEKDGLKISAFKKLINLGNDKIYFALSKSTGPAVTVKLQKSLDKIKTSPRYKDLLKKYDFDSEINEAESLKVKDGK